MRGKVLSGRYEVVRLLGRGGMGAVYEGRHIGTGRRVAIKVITVDLHQSPEVLSRFEVEARAAGGIESQHIAQVLDSGHDAEHGLPFLVMEYLSGEDLHTLLRRLGPLPVDLGMRIVAQACLGLEKAHQRNIIHRDIKPPNIFLNERDGDELVVKILDFGVAKIKSEEGLGLSSMLTLPGSLLGSPLYMSPEQIRSDKALDQRSDLWSLGVVFYQALTGRTPFQHVEALGALILAISSSPPPPLQDFAPWVPLEVAAIVHKALSVRPLDRFQSAGEMYRAIKALLPGGHHMFDKSRIVPMSDAERAPCAHLLVAARTAPGSRQPELQGALDEEDPPTLSINPASSSPIRGDLRVSSTSGLVAGSMGTTGPISEVRSDRAPPVPEHMRTMVAVTRASARSSYRWSKLVIPIGLAAAFMVFVDLRILTRVHPAAVAAGAAQPSTTVAPTPMRDPPVTIEGESRPPPAPPGTPGTPSVPLPPELKSAATPALSVMLKETASTSSPPASTSSPPASGSARAAGVSLGSRPLGNALPPKPASGESPGTKQIGGRIIRTDLP